ncbi:MAG: glycoside hydrolase family 30 protein [Prolixibacteraceae bacterium]|nr:glycoside hydrolase family 30 protein [Prolixibacteraceae bacterium]
MRITYISAILTLAFLTISCVKQNAIIRWTTSNPDATWQQSNILTTKNTSDSAIIVYPEKAQQLIDGFGGCFNELGWDALQMLTPKAQQKIVAALFDTVSGCKFNLCRMPMGANDYSVGWYSHNETPGDFFMENFSIERDRERLIPYINVAKAYNPDIKIWASPWCPPSWMKTNKHYACRSDVVNDLPITGQGEEMSDQFIMEEPYLNAYAFYFSKFISAYKNEGIEIYAVHVQNEPNSCQNFPSCIWTPGSLATFIGNYLGPRMKADHPETEIWLGTIERPQIERIDTVLQHPEAKKYIKGVGFQWAGKKAIPLVQKKYPGYKLMQTETECGNGSNDWKAAEYTFSLMKHYFNYGANAYLYWNMVLDETGKSRWGWKQNSMITINSETKQVTYNPEFYLMKHFSHYIEPGSHKIETSDPDCLAFKTNNSIVMVYFNNNSEVMKHFSIQERSFKVTLPAQSINTFIFPLQND